MRVFLSYAREDLPRVQRLKQALQLFGCQVWLDQEIGGGQAWWAQILGEIRSCDVFVTVLSRAYQQSRACEYESRYARSLRKPFLPVKVASVSMETLPTALATLNVLDYTQPDELTGIRLVQAVSRMPPAPALPDPLPPEPTIPLTALAGLSELIRAEQLTEAQQKDIVFDLREAFSHSQDVSHTLELARDFAGRNDLLHRVHAQVSELLVSPTASSNPVAKPETKPDVGHAVDPKWGPDELRKILRRSEPTFLIITSMMDQLAKTPGVRISRSALTKGIDPSLGTIAGALSALQRWLNHEFRKEYPKPFRVTVGPAEDPTIQTEAFYELPWSVANSWLKLRDLPN